MRLVFMGTPDFAVPTLKTLRGEKHDILLAVTQPDRPKGRGGKLAVSPVKETALKLGVAIAQPVKVREDIFVEHLQRLAPDVIVVVAFGQILPQAILDIPRYGCINLHASLLPKYRGAAPIHWAVLNGETETGNTTMLMDKGMDTGDILLVNRVPIGRLDTTGQVHDRLACTGALLMAETLAGLAAGTLTPVRQNHALASHAPKLTADMERIDWQTGSVAVCNKIRGLYPWPVAYNLTDAGERLKIHEARITGLPCPAGALPGQLIRTTADGFLLAAGDALLEILKVQPEGKKAMTAVDFLCGREHSKKDLMIFG